MNMKTRPLVVAIEGIDNLGKTTTCETVVQHFQQQSISTILEPEFENGPLGMALREVVVNNWSSVPPIAQPYIIAADRAHRYKRASELRRSEAMIVVFDRHLLTASVYQSLSNRISMVEMEAQLQKLYGSAYIRPDLTLLLDAPIETCIERGGDDIHSREFLASARDRYLAASAVWCINVIDARYAIEEVTEQAVSVISEFL